MPAVHTHSPRNTGPIELRDVGPNGRPLGTRADCQDGSPWELHRGELIRQMSSHEIHSIIMFLLGALFRTHARDGLSVMGDVYCELVEDDGSLSLRAPDVVLGKCVKRLKDGPFQGTPNPCSRDSRDAVEEAARGKGQALHRARLAVHLARARGSSRGGSGDTWRRIGCVSPWYRCAASPGTRSL